MKYMYLPTSTAHLAPSLKDGASSMQVTLSLFQFKFLLEKRKKRRINIIIRHSLSLLRILL